MENVYIVDAVRSPIGRFLGSFSELSATKLGAQTLAGLLARTKVNGGDVEEIFAGNVISAGVGQNPAKQVAIYSGLPKEISTTNVNKVCASGLAAVGLGAQTISTGNAGVIVAGGMESMSNAPFVLKNGRKFNKINNVNLAAFSDTIKQGGADPKDFTLVDEMVNAGLWDCYTDLHMGTLAEKIGEKYTITRQEQDEFAYNSHKKAAEATDSGKFKNEIIPVKLQDGRVIEADEGIRRDTTVEKLGTLKPAFNPNGTVTAGNASQLSDGASFALLMSESKMKAAGFTPLAKIESYASSGIDPSFYGMAPVTAMMKAMAKANVTMDNVDLIELNEAFCVQALGVIKYMKLDSSRVNVNGGATALGHPIGATGARLLATLAYSLKDRSKNIGVAALCHGGGGAAAMVIRRV